jgi:PEGA domain
MLRSKTFLVWSAFLAMLCSTAVLSSQAPSKTVKIPDATPVHLSLQDSLSSAANKVGDAVHFLVTADVKVGHLVVIPNGSTATGHVVEAKSKTILGRSGKLNFTVDHVKAPDGTDIRLRASSTRKAEETSGTLLAVPFNLILGGKDVNIPKGTEFNSYVDGDQEITFGGPTPAREAPPAVESAPPPTSQEPSTVIVKSSPDGADIRVDGKYVGSTPSTLRLAPGDHSVVVEKPGYRQWQRTMSVSSGGIITIDAQMEAQ